MIVASSMTLLSDARNGRKGGLLPWVLLIIGSGASLVANVAVADPTMWSRIIHAWPSFALIGAYELLMRQFRANAAGVRSAHIGRTHSEETPREGERAPASAEREQGPHLHVVPAEGVIEEEEGAVDPLRPQVQRDAWAWALENRHPDGSLPTGGEIAHRFGRKERWGRLVKQWGAAGASGPSTSGGLYRDKIVAALDSVRG